MGHLKPSEHAAKAGSATMTTPRINRLWHALSVLSLSIGLFVQPGVGRAQTPPQPPAAPARDESFAIMDDAAGVTVGAAAGQPPVSAGATVSPTASEALGAPLLADVAAAAETDTSAEASGPQRNSAGQLDAAIAVDASVFPIATAAGSTITYTYRYTNTTAGALSGISTLINWSRMSLGVPSAFDGSTEQYCESGCSPINVSGPAVTQNGYASSSISYTIGSLSASQSGQFSVVMRLRKTTYPKTGQPPTRPASSVQMYINNDLSSPIVDNTVSALVIGPVLDLRKTVVPGSPSQITISDTVDFSITIGNAYSPADVIDGQARADARPATNTILWDEWPAGTIYVPTSDPPGITRTVDYTGRRVIWELGTIGVQQTKHVVVRFRKDNSADACSVVYNQTYRATANEYPLQEDDQPYEVAGGAAGIAVVPVLQVRTFETTNYQVPYGDATMATIVVANHYSQSISGAQLAVFPNDALTYVAGSAAPGGINALPGVNYGKPVTWTFDIAAGSASAPRVMTFTLFLRAGFFLPQDSSASARVFVPSNQGIPVSCSSPQSRNISIVPRLDVQIRQFPYDAGEFVAPGAPYGYEITVNNRSSAIINNVVVTAALPSDSNYPANFSYRVGTATLNSVAREPNRVVNGNGGYLAWDGLSLSANGSLKIYFSLQPDGYEYVLYCVNALAASPEDPPVAASSGQCIRINPPFNLSKVASPPYVLDVVTPGGREVTFTLMMTNTGAQNFVVGLYDRMGEFTLVRQVSSNNGTPTLRPDGDLEWPLQTLGPGQRLEAVIVARIPEGCPATRYENELAFRFTARDNQVYRVKRVPPMNIYIDCTSVLEYNLGVDRGGASLYDRVQYTVQLNNKSPGQTMSNITVRNLLPSGFTYESMTVDSSTRAQPAISSGPSSRQLLQWTVSSLAPGQTKIVRFIVRTGNVIGTYENWALVTSPEPLATRCLAFFSQCVDVDMGNGATPGTAVVTNVDALATLEPSLNNSACALPGGLRQYELAMVNTNSHSYRATTLRIRVPFGLHVIDTSVSGSAGVTTLPSISHDGLGNTIVTWTDVELPARPLEQTNSQILFLVNIRFGQILGDTPIIAEASSPDGSILNKDDALNPIIKRCAQSSAQLLKDAHAEEIGPGEPIIYQITLVNALSQTVMTTLRDVLPAGLTYSSTLIGPAPSVNGQALTWSTLTILPATGDGPGIFVVRFVARAANGVTGVIINRGDHLGSNQPVNTNYASVAVRLGNPFVLLPLVRR
jgi:uncharacterized repeat protein (TIGR01451 family)